MAATLQAIPTRYKGYHFRSRLEARWAVFFDALGMNWEYEPQGFDIGGTCYLPDFRVTSDDGLIGWWEIKPEATTADSKFSQFANLMDECYENNDIGSFRAYLASGDPYSIFYRQSIFKCPRCWKDAPVDNHSDLWAFDCYQCDTETESGGGNPWYKGFANIPYTPSKGYILTDPNDYNDAWIRINHACAKSRSARFEHGECGAT